MSWLGYKTKKAETEDPREAKRKRLEAERSERLHRAQQRLNRRKQLEAAEKAQEEANQALQELLDLDPDIFNISGENPSQEIVTEDILNDSADTMADFDVENGEDGKSAMDKLGSVKCEFSKEDLDFWFTELETQLEVIEVKSQWTKRIALQRFLPAEIKEEVKSLLKIQKANQGEAIYKRIKTELLDLFGAKPEDGYLKAKSRVMSGKPSQLGKQLIDDICVCDVKLAGKCCTRMVWGMFRDALPVIIRNHIADLEFSKDTYKQIFAKCDQIYDSNRSARPAVVAATTTQQTSAQPTVQPEVAATSTAQNSSRRNRNKNQNQNRGGGASNKANTAPPPKPATQQPPKGPKHSTAHNGVLCKIHHKWGVNANFCSNPTVCVMKDIYKSPQ